VTFALSAWIALTAARFFFLSQTEAAGEEFGRHLAGHGLSFYAHAGGGAVALITGALQWVLTPRSRRSRWHRLIGRTYVLAIAVGGLSGLSIAVGAFGGLVPRAGFSTLAVAWLASTAIAWTRARARDWTTHRAWMIRSFALTFAAVTLRVWLPTLLMAGLSFEAAYRLVAWLAWIPNLLLAEWLIARQLRSGPEHAELA
jgi:uncharacterized membrane protein